MNVDTCSACGRSAKERGAANTFRQLTALTPEQQRYVHAWLCGYDPDAIHKAIARAREIYP